MKKLALLLLAFILPACALAQPSFISGLTEQTSCTTGDWFIFERTSPNLAHKISCTNLATTFGVAVDLGDDSVDEITRLLRINTSGDTNAIFTETVTDELTIDLSLNWPSADTADALSANGTNCAAGNYPLGVDAAGNAESCTAAPSASNSFETMNAPAGTDPVADSSTDTLNLAATGILTITGDSATDTLTFDATEVDGSTTNELQNLFQTVDAPSGTDPVADSTTDTLTLAASGIVTITGDSGTDTITIDATEVDGSTSNEIQNLFETISTTSGTSPVADSSTDTLTLTAGSGITITGDSSTDTVTIAATGGGTTITVQEDDSTVDGSTSTLDFTEADATVVTSSPAGEANVNLGLYALLAGRSTSQIIRGNSGTDSNLELAANAGSCSTCGSTASYININESFGAATYQLQLDGVTYQQTETVSLANFGSGVVYQLETGGILGIENRVRIGDADADANSECIAKASGKSYLYHDTDCDGVEDSGEDNLSDDLPEANDITEAMLKAVDTAADEEYLTYETTTGDFEWQTRKTSLATHANEMSIAQGTPTLGIGGQVTPAWTMADAVITEVCGTVEIPQHQRGATFDLYVMAAPSSTSSCNFRLNYEYKLLATGVVWTAAGTNTTPTSVASGGTANTIWVFDSTVNVATASTTYAVNLCLSRNGAHANDSCSNSLYLLELSLEEQ